MRLEKFLITCGIATGKVIKKIVLNGEIRVNGQVELNYGRQIEPNIDKILYLDEELHEKDLKYFIFNKPAGYLTAVSNPVNDKPVIMDLIPPEIEKRGLAPVGRLDRDTEGLLIITNDGNLNHILTYPDKVIDKEYYVELNREITPDNILQLEKGVEFDGHLSKPAKVKFLTSKSITLTITEGKYHQVKKMLKAVGNRVIYLKRIRMGKLELGDLPLGEIREIKREDII